ncbi:glycoside hydrolase family 2 TIM barrel-domain containing protein [Streptomyces sp. TS71-3]|uniref:glycoside hydrolase family 2 TIM barrel-domain containing protein n=1 Tax=Streptomyces sp. TS71-3 TaxID=2733862 RepID=UPI001B03F4E7|nr:glycoside hydrolase family 2 TIM barrel-domain containing protein [Streptomyces sp. TS71-3]GHJ42216.1 beta-galactosidase [Streptomyces sp. TS71-3]
MAISRRTALSGAGVAALAGAAALRTAAPASAAVGAAAGSDSPAPDLLPDAGSVRTVDLRQGWRFVLVNTTGEDAPQPAAGDAGWRDVDLPHDWSIELDPRRDEHTTAGSGYLPGGLGWYTKTFTLPQAALGKRLSVEFDGVYMDAQVHFNGELVAAHPYGYTGFAADLTTLAHTDGTTPNMLAVRVRNQIPSSRWYSGSGIYRDVRLVVTDAVHLTRHGVTVTTPGLAESLAAQHAEVQVAAVAVSTEGAVPAQVTAVVVDPDGKVVAGGRTMATLTGMPTTATIRVRVDHPRLWSTEMAGVLPSGASGEPPAGSPATPGAKASGSPGAGGAGGPALYTVHTSVSVYGRTRDETTTRFGFRHFAFDPDHGFSLNGRRTKLQGVNLHHDQGALGSAFHPDAARRQLTLMRQMGVNALRTSHNPPAPGLVGLCDELGVLLMVEAFDCWRTPKNPYDYGRFFDGHSHDDITEMVNAAKNSPAVVMWSIGNEIPDSTSAAGVPMAKALIEAVRAADPTRPVVIGSDKYRDVPEDGSPRDLILRMLDGVGLNYNTAASVDALHAKYPDTFFFESESSSSTSARGVYDNPGQLNTGENYTPGRRGVSSYDNNLESWTMSGEYVLKKDRDREFHAGQFVWSGIDYLGEPTPYSDVFPVKSSFFGAVDTAGFPKDQFFLFRSQWSQEPMVHLLPMDWTGHRPKEEVTVWAYSNAEEAELFLNGSSLGVRRFDRKKTGYGTAYLETTEATGDDKTVTSGPYPGSYTSPNGSAGHLRLTWQVPFAPGKLVAVARRNGAEVARDVLRTAGQPAALRLTADRTEVTADGRALFFVTAEVTDARGVTVPDAGHALTFTVTGGHLAGADNGRQESAENHQSATRSAFNGKALAIVRAGRDAGRITVTAHADGLRPDSASVTAREAKALPASAAGAPDGTTAPAQAAATAPAASSSAASGPEADAGFSGAPDTVPAKMLDGDPATAWSNAYTMAPTALLPAISEAHPTAWVSLTWPERRRVGAVEAVFTIDGTHDLPASATVSHWNGREYVPVDRPVITWATASDQPTVIAFEPVATSAVRIDLTSRRPHEAGGFLRIVSLRGLPAGGEA